MDVSVTQLGQSLVDQTAQRAVGPGAQGGASAGAQVTSFSQAFPDPSARSGQTGMVGLVDRLRVDFEAFRARVNLGADPSLVRQSQKSSVEKMDEVIAHALRAQVDIFEMSVSFNAGLTATQQSQSGVKTLIEKT